MGRHTYRYTHTYTHPSKCRHVYRCTRVSVKGFKCGFLFVRNEEVAALTGLSSLSDIICRRRSAIFGHIARLDEEVPAHKALRNCISLSLGRLPDPSWKRRPGRPRGRWMDQFRRDQSATRRPWRQAINRGHSGRATQRSSDYATT